MKRTSESGHWCLFYIWRSSRIVPAGVTIAIQPAALKSGIMDGHAMPPPIPPPSRQIEIR